MRKFGLVLAALGALMLVAPPAMMQVAYAAKEKMTLGQGFMEEIDKIGEPAPKKKAKKKKKAAKKAMPAKKDDKKKK